MSPISKIETTIAIAAFVLCAHRYWKGRKIEIIKDEDVEHIWQMRKPK